MRLDAPRALIEQFLEARRAPSRVRCRIDDDGESIRSQVSIEGAQHTGSHGLFVHDIRTYDDVKRSRAVSRAEIFIGVPIERLASNRAISQTVLLRRVVHRISNRFRVSVGQHYAPFPIADLRRERHARDAVSATNL